MSYSEINSRNGGIPDGGMPYDILSYRLEETDPELIANVRGYDEFHDIADEYQNYTRQEIIDWTPDAPFLESDHARRDPGISRSRLNLQYNGTRGSHPELPRHPELFIGFTGNDARGATNDPRFDQIRGQMTARAAELTVAMGDNDDHHVAERPWTNQSISYGMKEMFRRVKGNTKIFSVQKEGRPWGRNVVTNDYAAGWAQNALRVGTMKAGDEALVYRTGDYEDGPEGHAGHSNNQQRERFAAGDHAPATEALSGSVRGAGVDHTAEAAPWRHATGDVDLGVQAYGQRRGAGRTALGHGAQGGGRVQTSGADQDWASSQRARGANRQVLGASMALAAKSRAAAHGGKADQAYGASLVAYNLPGEGLAPSRDVAALYRHVTEEQSRRPYPMVQDGDGGSLGSAAGLTPAAHPEHAIRATHTSHVSSNPHLANVEAIVSGLRAGDASSRRRIANQVVADGPRGYAPAEGVGGPRGYGAPGRLEQKTGYAQGSAEEIAWRRARENLPVGRSKAPGEWRSNGQAQTDTGLAPDEMFGYADENRGYGGAAPAGPKRLRAGVYDADDWEDSTGLPDGM